MDEVGFIAGQVEPLVARLEGLVMLVDIYGLEKIFRRLNFLY